MTLTSPYRTAYPRRLSAPCLLALIFGMLGQLPIVAIAGQFSVSPVRIFVTPKDRTTAVTVTNEGDVELVMQADAYAWRQTAAGEEVLTLTEDVVVSPPILKLAPRGKQVVRLAVLAPAQPGKQQTFRLIVREIPEVKPPEPGAQLRIAVAFSMPIFVTQPGAAANLVCDLKQLTVSVAQANCQNNGTAYVQATEVKLVTTNTLAGDEVLASDNTAVYLLPGTQRVFNLKRTGGTSPAAGKQLRLLVTKDDQSVQSFDVQPSN